MVRSQSDVPGFQQGQCRQADVVDHRVAAAIQQPGIAVEKVHEQKRAAALVAIGKRVILDDEIQQMRRLGLHARVGGFAKHRLVEDFPSSAPKASPLLAGEEIGGLTPRHQIRLEPRQGCTCLDWCWQRAAALFRRLGQQPLVVALQQ